MSTLGQLGVNGLLAVNSWIGVINSNLVGSSRTAYKPTRVTLLDAPAITYSNQIQIPPATLNVQATSFEWGQGSIINSNQRSHFALQGQGFFVVTDTVGRMYLTRDGEFHWDGNGYLVNSAGLRVLSSGQDFIRYGRGDRSDTFDFDGESQELARYGDKSLLVVDVANRDGLRMSQYGSTIFALDGDLPLRVKNSFATTMDGLTFLYRDPKQRTYVDAPERPAFIQSAPGIDTNFSIDLGGNGIFTFDFAGGPFAGIPFDPAVHTIQDVVTAINAYGTANNTTVTASYDPDRDRLSIVNVPEPKVPDPGFNYGNFAIDFGANGYFTYHGFDPNTATIQSVVDAINRFALQRGVNINASYNPVTDTFSLTNTTAPGQDNRINFDGSNGQAMARFMQMAENNPSTGGGAHGEVSTTDIDLNPPSGNPFTDISPFDVNNTPLAQLVQPLSRIQFGGANGKALQTFFQLGNSPTPAFDINGNQGGSLESLRDIDNSSILDSSVPGEHSLDIAPGDVGLKSFLTYVTTSDITVPTYDFSGPPPLYSHDKPNGRIVSDGTLNNGHGLLAIQQAQVTTSFDLVVDFLTTSNRLELHFGYIQEEMIDSQGFSLYYDPASGDLGLISRSRDPNDPPTILDVRPGALGTATGLAGTPHRLSTTLNSDGQLVISIDGSTPEVFNISSFSQQGAGHVSLGHQGGRLEVYNLYADFKGQQNQLSTGELVAVGPTDYAKVEVRDPYQDREKTRIVQAALESSTASLTEYVPLLAIAQKVFASISKIISTSVSMQDDMNSLIR